MSKICGLICTGEATAHAHSQLEAMAQTLRHVSDAQAQTALFAGGGIAVITNPSSVGSRVAQAADGGRSMGFIGHAAAPGLDSGRQTPGELDAALLDLLARDSDAAYEKLNGVFVLAGHDASTGTLRVVNDRFGFAPVYYYHDRNIFAFASELKALLKILPPQELDWHAAADFFYIGHLMGTRTLFRSIRTAEPGQVLSVRNGELSSRRYFVLTELGVRPRQEVSTQALADLFTQSVDRRAWPASPHTVLLSGGFDSRLILGAMAQLGVRPRCISLEHASQRGGADGRFAVLTAEALGMDCELRPTRPDYAGTPHWLEVFYLHDGMVPSHNLFISEVYPELDTHLGALWDGMAMGVGLAGQHVTEAGAEASLPDFWFERARARRLLRLVLDRDVFHALDDGFEQRVRDDLARVPAGQNQFQNFLMHHRIRRRIAVNPHQLYTNKGEPVTPGADRDFLDYALSVPVGMKIEHKLYAELFRKHFPVLAKIPAITAGKIVPLDGADLLAGLPPSRRGGTVGRVARPLAQAGRASGRLLRSMMPGQDRAIFADPSSRLIVRALEQRMFRRPIYNRRLLEPLLTAFRRGNSALYKLFAVALYIELWHLLFIDRDAGLLLDPHGAASRLMRDQPAPAA